ncbi:unnamed protein product, partial [Clonostachys solani]
MGRPITVSSQIEIKASPASVRSVFLDFPRYKYWQQGWEITPNRPNETKFNLSIGSRLRVNIHGENSAECFSWEATLPGFSGKRNFYFSPSKVNPGATTFIQEEHFTGALTHMFGAWTKKNPQMVFWDLFNAALKKEVETSTTQTPELGDTSMDSQAYYTPSLASELGDTSVQVTG